jgi:hypothetical protein
MWLSGRLFARIQCSALAEFVNILHVAGIWASVVCLPVVIMDISEET